VVTLLFFFLFALFRFAFPEASGGLSLARAGLRAARALSTRRPEPTEVAALETVAGVFFPRFCFFFAGRFSPATAGDIVVLPLDA
jgi:hypothetical protein